jgi:tetratricopeptide (TPR) repeat protein
MSNQNSETSPAMQEAMRLFQEGETVRAEETMLAAVAEAERRFGPRTPEYAAAQNELGTVLLNVGHYHRAVEAYREACAGPMPAEELALRDRLTFLMNLGLALQLAGELEEAEQVLREGLEGRRDHYGQDHPGYAFGLEPLASLLLRLGRAEGALKYADAAVQNFWRNGHPRVATALAVRAEALKAAGRDTPPFAHLEGLPNEIIEEMAEHVIERVEHTDPLLSRQVLLDLAHFMTARFGESRQITLNVLARLGNLESDLGEQGDPQIRLWAIRRVIDACDQDGHLRDALQAMQGLALAYSDAGQQEDALAAYQEVVARADRLGQPGLLSQARRNYGLYLAESGRRREAEEQMRLAVTDAERSSDTDEEVREMLGRAQVALGIFLQHGEQFPEARQLLAQALQLLDPAHPDAVCGRSHLTAIEAGSSCGCGDTGLAVADAFREFVQSRLPSDLLEHFAVELNDNDFAIEVHLNREPTEEELEHLNRVIQHAYTEFRQRLQQNR